MITIYLDNFRGFEKTHVPLQSVNFLVGENSTGKTSALAAIQLLSESSFWFSGRFQSNHVDLGTFSDIVRPGGERFQIGLAADEPEPSATLFTFTSDRGTPELSALRMSKDNESIELVRAENYVYYRRRILDISRGNADPTTLLRRWAQEDAFDINGFEKTSHDIPRSMPLGVVLSLIPRASVSAPLSRAQRKSRPVRPSFDSDALWAMAPARPLGRLTWIAPIRAKPRRIYEDRNRDDYSPEGEHLPHVLRRMSIGSPERQQQVAEYGRESGLFNRVHVHKFGTDEGAPFRLDVDLGDTTASIPNVGYGVSQALPVVAEIVQAPARTWFAIQQPEVHLHPRAQATMGELFFKQAERLYSKRFIVETHSDYVIDRFRSCMRKTQSLGQAVPTAQLLFFERAGGRNTATTIRLSNDGDYPSDLPTNFRSFFLQEELRNLGF